MDTQGQPLTFSSTCHGVLDARRRKSEVQVVHNLDYKDVQQISNLKLVVQNLPEAAGIGILLEVVDPISRRKSVMSRWMRELESASKILFNSTLIGMSLSCEDPVLASSLSTN